MYILLIKWW